MTPRAPNRLTLLGLRLPLGFAVTVAALTASACAHRSSAPVGVCQLAVPVTARATASSVTKAVPLVVDRLDADFWGMLLLRGYDRDCTGVRIGAEVESRCPADLLRKRHTSAAIEAVTPRAPTESPSKAEAAPPVPLIPLTTARGGELLPPRPLTIFDVVLSPVGNTQLLVWLKTHHFKAGQAQGPVALVRFDSDTAVVVAIGSMRAWPEGLTLRLETLAGQRVLVAESRRPCTADETVISAAPGLATGANSAAAPCEQVVQLLALQGSTLTAVPMMVPGEECVPETRLSLTRLERRAQPGGKERTYQLTSRMTFDADVATIVEKVEIHDRNARVQNEPPRLLRSTQGARTLRLDNGRAVMSEQSLLEQLESVEEPSSGS